MAFAAAACIALAIFLRPQAPPVCVAAAQDHEREIENGSGVPESAIAALGTTGYLLERGKIRSLEKQILLHLVYTKAVNRFSVYLKPRGALGAREK